MTIEKLKPSALADNIRRYREKGLATGGPYSLAELLAEEARRKHSPFGVIETVNAIIRTAKESPDGLATYLEIWKSLTDEPWQGNNSQTQMANALARVIHYCRQNNMPILTTLVVKTQGRQLSPAAKANIFAEAREIGYDTGADVEAFIADHRSQATSFVTSTP